MRQGKKAHRKHRQPAVIFFNRGAEERGEEAKHTKKTPKARQLLNTSNLTTDSQTNAFLMDELFMCGSLDCYAEGTTQGSFIVLFAPVISSPPQFSGFPSNQLTLDPP